MPMQVFLDGPEGRIQVGDSTHMDLVLQPSEVYIAKMGALLKGSLAQVRGECWDLR
jgi:hypothetical protein